MIEPTSERELLSRAHGLAGRTIDELSLAHARASRAGHKGFVGSLIERALGLVQRGAGPDLPSLGIELKTIPIATDGRPRESTFVCMVPRDGLDREWNDSAPHAKLARVLFVPVERDGARRVGMAFFWSPSDGDEATLASDWTELAGLLRTRGHEHVSAHHGQLMQVRPKARNAASRWRATGDDEAPMLALPRAFYLRRRFVASILSRTGMAGPRGET